MFDIVDRETLADADDAALVQVIADATRAEAVAAGARAAAVGELLARNEASHDPRWVFDGFNATAAEVGAAMGLSPRRAATLVRTAAALRDRLPRIGELLRRGAVSERVANVMCWRTGLIEDPVVAAAVDADLAEMAETAGVLSDRDLDRGIDSAICAHDPDARRRVHDSARYRDIQFGKPDDQAGVRSVFGAVTVDDGDFLEARLQALVDTVCRQDPRRLGERRADALRVAVAGGTVLPCHCNRPDCPQALAAGAAAGDAVAAGTATASGAGTVVDASRGHVVIHVLADQAAIEAAIREAGEQADLGTPWLAARHMVPGRCPAEEGSRRARRAAARARRRVTRSQATVPGQPNPAGQAAAKLAAAPVRARANARCRGSVTRGRGSKAGSRGSTRRSRPRSAQFRRPPESPPPPSGPPVVPAPLASTAAPPVVAAPGVATGPGAGRAVLLGGAIVPGPLLAEMVRTGAKIVALKAPSLDPEPRYRPSARLAWFVRARDLRCRFPGCNRPAENCDIDHVEPYPGGPTHPGNHALFCRLHHVAKTHHGWVARLEPDGTLTVTSPHGQAYRSPPPARVLFPQWNITTPLPPKTESGQSGAVGATGAGTANSTGAKAKGPGNTGVQPGNEKAGRGIPRRSRTRAAERAWRIRAEREDNRVADAAYDAELEAVLGPLPKTRPRGCPAPEPAETATYDEPPPF